MVLKIHWEITKQGFRRWSTYRAATVAGVFTNTVFGFVKAAVLVSVYRHRTDIGGFDLTDALTFTFITQGMLAVTAVFGWQEISLRVRTGDIAGDLCRPVDFVAWWMAQDYGRAAYHAIARGIIPFVAGALAFRLAVSTRPIDWLAFAAAMVLAVWISFCIRFLVNLTAFWIVDARGPIQLVMVVWMFLSGFIVPIGFFPPAIEAIARVSPFASIVQLPVEVLLGKHPGLGLIGVLATQLAWAAVLFACSRIALRAAIRKLVVQGG